MRIIMEEKKIDIRTIIRTDSSKIHISCHHFRNVSVSIRWNEDGFTLGTVKSINNTLFRKTVISYTGKPAHQAIFSSAKKVGWILYEERRTEKCTDRQETLWIAACQAIDRDCNSCKINSFKRDITKSPIAGDIIIVTKSSILAADNCFVASTYLILWHEIRDVFPPDQYSSQRPSPTAVYFTTLSDSASYTTVEEKSSPTRLLQTTRSLTPIHSEQVSVTSTVEEKSSPTRLLQTTRSLTPIHSEQVSVTSTAGSMLIDDNKPDQISDNQKVIGLTVGASISAVIIVILLTCLLVVLRRRSIERKSAKKNQTVQNSEDGNDYTGRQNIALPMQEDLSEYNELVMRRDSHQYGDLTSMGTKLNETTYDYIDHHKHKQETDICKTDKINSIQDPGDELIHDYSVLDPNEKTLNTVKVMSNTGRDGDTYAVLDPDESTTFCSGTDISDRLDKPCCKSNNNHTKELTCSQTKDEAYAVLDPNITGFDRTENVSKNESPETYTVLDPSITGFNRSDLTNTNGDMTKNQVNKNGLVQPFKEDGTDYEFAKPIDDDLSSKSCLPSNRHRTNSGGSYGTYETGKTHQRQDIHQQNPEENVYNRTVDDVYDSAAHIKMPTSRDDTYDHFSGEKKND
ncbi:uncharacterized protein LOC134727087 [Mytilus trossulus]|uniref:uncharacterized protein LOC134727087 n=1 Tax=Mytilus trossulus TaxID=6551 RepID=UPI003007C431